MPCINGIEVTRQLKEINPDIAVVILTSHSVFLDDAMGAFVFRFLSEPIQRERFIRSFTEALAYCNRLSRRIAVESGNEVYSVKTKDILYITSCKQGSDVVTAFEIYRTAKKPSEWCRFTILHRRTE